MDKYIEHQKYKLNFFLILSIGTTGYLLANFSSVNIVQAWAFPAILLFFLQIIIWLICITIIYDNNKTTYQYDFLRNINLFLFIISIILSLIAHKQTTSFLLDNWPLYTPAFILLFLVLLLIGNYIKKKD
ncbi:hypothetical protein ACFL2K_01655 [Candidatus Margulisiibacteriota bacterium]